MDNKKSFFFGVFDKKNDKFIGTTTLQIDTINKIAYYGYLIGDKNYWGTNAGIDTIALLMDFGFENFDINDENKINEVIKNLKTNYENEWKKINQINSSINLSVTLSLDNKKYSLIRKFEKKLKNLDLVASFYIEKFSEKNTIYKVIFNGTPDKFISELTTDGFDLETSSAIWIIK